MVNGQTLGAFASGRALIIEAVVSSLALLVYDYFLVLHMELEYIWRSPWKPVKAVYLLTRYPAFVDVTVTLASLLLQNGPAPALCRGMYVFESWSYLAGTEAADVILLLRTWAIWKKDRNLGVVLVVIFLLNVATVCFLLHRYNSSLVYMRSPFPDLDVCFTASEATPLWTVFVSQCIIESGVLILTLIKGYQHLRTGDGLLLTTLYRDGLVFTSFTLIASLANMAVLNSLNTKLFQNPQVGVALQRVVHAVLCCRVVLHLRASSPEQNSRSRSVSLAVGGTKTAREDSDSFGEALTQRTV